MQSTPKLSGIHLVCQIAGSQTRLAQQLGVSPQVVNKWVRQGWVPLGRALAIEQRFGVQRSLTMNPKILKLVADQFAL